MDEKSYLEIARELAADLTEAWNVHDMSAFASCFHDDAAFVNVAGMYARGRNEIQAAHETAHTTIFHASTLATQLEDARSPGDGVIVAHVSSELLGDARAPDQVRRALMTLVIEQRQGDWKISSAHNTNVVPTT